jgi:hypothetical protein
MRDRYSAPGGGDFQVGRVLNRGFDLLLGDFLKFFGMAVIIWLPILLLSLFGGALFAFAGGDAQNMNSAALVVGAITMAIVFLILSVLSQAAVLYGAFQKMRGQTFTIGTSFSQGFARLLPIIGMLIVMGLALAFGFVLLIVPAFILTAMWYVALPACVIERLGPLASLGRSASLTKGDRWKIFGIYFLIFIANQIVSAVLSRILGGGIVSAIGNFLWVALVSAFQSIVVAVTYHDLRAAKEGIGVDRIAQIFE